MTTVLRIILIAASVIYLLFVLLKIKRAKILIGDSIFWILFAVVLIIFSIFPNIVSFGTRLIGMQTDSNFIYLVVIFILMLRSFLSSMKISQLEIKLRVISQKIALEEQKNNNYQKPSELPGTHGGIPLDQ